VHDTHLLHAVKKNFEWPRQGIEPQISSSQSPFQWLRYCDSRLPVESICNYIKRLNTWPISWCNTMSYNFILHEYLKHYVWWHSQVSPADSLPQRVKRKFASALQCFDKFPCHCHVSAGGMLTFKNVWPLWLLQTATPISIRHVSWKCTNYMSHHG
jgi:hypothetical protein